MANEHARDPPWKWKVWDAAWPSLRARALGGGKRQRSQDVVLYGSATAPACTDCPGLASVSRGGWGYRLCSAASCQGMETPCLGCEGYSSAASSPASSSSIPSSSSRSAVRSTKALCSSGIITRSWRARWGGVAVLQERPDGRRQPVAASQGRQASFSLGQGFFRIDFPLARAIPLLV